MSPVGVVVFPVNSKVYVANNGSGTVSVIDTGTNKVTATIPAGSGPFGLVLHPNNQIYVTGGSDTVNVIDTATDTNAGNVTDGTNLSVPLGIGAHSGTNLIYLVNRGFNNVVTMNASLVFGASIPVGTLPSGIAVDSANDRAYVTNNGDPQTSPGSTVTVINTTTNTVVGVPVTVGSAPDGIDIDALNNKTYVANSLSNTVSVIDNTTDLVVATIPVGAGPAGVAVDSGNSLAYVTNFDDNTVSVIDTTMDVVTATIHI
jgi:YVTN family beta-propeller protein